MLISRKNFDLHANVVYLILRTNKSILENSTQNNTYSDCLHLYLYLYRYNCDTRIRGRRRKGNRYSRLTLCTFIYRKIGGFLLFNFIQWQFLILTSCCDSKNPTFPSYFSQNVWYSNETINSLLTQLMLLPRNMWTMDKEPFIAGLFSCVCSLKALSLLNTWLV